MLVVAVGAAGLGLLPPVAQVAVGYAQANLGGPVPEMGADAHWSPEAVPPGAQDGFSDGGWLISVSCPKPENCVAFGGYGDRSGNSDGLLAQLAGRSWKAQLVATNSLDPRPRKTGQAVVPDAVVCPAPGQCAAVGSYTSAGGYQEGLTDTEVDGRWSMATATLGGLVPAPGADPHLLFGPLDCPAPGACVATGSYEDRRSALHPFVEVLSGGHWRAETVSLNGLSPAPTGVDAYTHLDGVSCWAAGQCVAVGTYLSAKDGARAFAASMNANSWSMSALPITGFRPPAGHEPGLEMVAVHCPAAGHCTAVGTYRTPSGVVIGMTESLSQGKWSAATLPTQDLVPAPAGTVGITPTALSCPTTSFCAVVGTYRDLYGDVQGFAETWRSGKWSAWTLPTYSLTPEPKPKAVFAIDGVSCPVPGLCTAIGYYGGEANESHAMIEDLSGGIWTALSAPELGLDPPAGAFPGSALDSVDCPTANYCAVVGNYSGLTGVSHGLAEVFSG